MSKRLLVLFLFIVFSANMFAVDYSYVSTRTLVVIYSNFQDGSESANINSTTKSTIIDPAVAFWRAFYWRNSHMKVNLEVSYLIIADTLDFADLNSNFALDPVRIRADLVARSIDPKQYGNVTALYAFPRVTWDFWGLTWPVLDSTGECVFTCIPSSWFSKLREILVHEYNHTLDNLNTFNSLPAYPYNHIPQYTTQGNTGPYNCLFDLNAGIVRDWPVSQWTNQSNFAWGATLTTVDADNDGVPDSGTDRETIPLSITESSLGSSTGSADTDSDGLSDFNEVMAHYYNSSSLTTADSDGDGLSDGKDPYPIYNATTYCAKAASVAINGAIASGEHHLAKYVTETSHTAYTYLDWDSNNLYVSFQVLSSSGVFNDRSLYVYIDENADGIIQGNENYVIYAGPAGGSLSIRAYQLQTGEWAATGQEYTSHNITGAMQTTSNSLTLELAIPATSPVGIDLAHGKKFGVQISFLTNPSNDGRQDVLTGRFGEDMEFLNIVLRDNAEGKDFKVQYKTNITSDPTNQIGPILNLVNTGFETISLSDCKIRYYYTCENPATQQFNCDYIPYPRSSSQVTGQFVQSGNNYYLEVGFQSAAGSLAPGASTGEVQTRFNKSNWSNYTQSNDYSYNGTYQNLTDYNKIAVYYKGSLVWGVTP